jgi:hypothetical protein
VLHNNHCRHVQIERRRVTVIKEIRHTVERENNKLEARGPLCQVDTGCTRSNKCVVNICIRVNALFSVILVDSQRRIRTLCQRAHRSAATRQGVYFTCCSSTVAGKQLIESYTCFYRDQSTYSVGCCRASPFGHLARDYARAGRADKALWRHEAVYMAHYRF